MAVDRSYEDGLRDGKIEAVEETLGKHSDRLGSHSRRLSKLEKVSWIIIGGAAVIQALPLLQNALRMLGKG